MDAYNLSNKIKNLWVLCYNKNSGLIDKSAGEVNVYIDGKQVIDAVVDDKGNIELKVQND